MKGKFRTITYVLPILLLSSCAGTGKAVSVEVSGGPIAKPSTKGLVAYWSFDEGSGTVAKDASGNNNTAKFIGSPKWVEGKSGKAIELDGKGSYLEVAPSKSLDSIKKQLTISAWVKTDFSKRGAIVENWFYDKSVSPQIGKRAYICTAETGGQKGLFQFTVSPGKKGEGGGSVKSKTPAQPGKWVHVTFVSDGKNVKVYLNGKLDAIAAGPSSIFQSKHAIHIGAWQCKEASGPPVGCFFKGVIDEVKIYNRALSDKEILAEFVRTVGSGDIAGKVVDEKGNPIKGAIVSCGALSTTTDAKGKFKLTGVPAVANEIKVSKAGYIAKTLSNVLVKKDKTTTIKATLKEASKVITVATDGTGDFNCDGVNDEAEINEAIRTIEQIGGGTVHLKAGTYIINGAIVPCSNLVFEGEGEDKTLIKIKDQNNTPQWSAFLLKGVSNVTIRRFKIDGNWRGQRGIGINSDVDGFRITAKSKNVVIEHITCYDFPTDGYEFTSGCENCVVRYCKALHCGHDGLRTIYCKKIKFSNNHVEAHGTGNTGVRVYTSSDCVIENNYLNTYGFGIEIEIQSPKLQKGNVYRGNYIEAHYGLPGIWVFAWEGTIKDAVFERNIVAKCVLRGGKEEPQSSSGIAFETRDGGKIRNMLVINNVFNEANYGIRIKPGSDVKGVVARNNIIVNNRKYGIFGKVASSYNNLWNNKEGKYANGAQQGTGDISVDPLFANPKAGDFHLKSQAGRWDPKTKKWVKDDVTSPCIDAGDPKDDFSKEPAPNGGRINMGAYGNTHHASKSQK